MVIQQIAFYLFSFVAIASAFMVIAARNPVHSVLFLILTFFNAAGLFVLLGAEFLAMILVIVYVGAVAVLFLFVVMMLDINFTELRHGFLQYLPVGAAVGIVLMIELLFVLGTWITAPEAKLGGESPISATATNTHALGQILYTDYVYLFQGAGILLLVAMIGAIVLTLRSREGVRRQSASEQTGRRRADAIEIKKVAPGQGI
ncbi:MAG: NADH-quinone oxidoreductase subunit J [Alphaproteobacteria bacterium]|nr:NADH-quinone oxidoreductase subunit J [Alphaproteobacteria bacterium]